MALRMERAVAAWIEEHRLLLPGQRVGVAVSGGADSVCLLSVLRDLAGPWNLSLSVLHLDHRLRGEASREDARFVEDLARRWGLPFVLREERPTGKNLEQAAREVRRAFFAHQIANG